MSSQIAGMCDAVVDKLNAATLSQPFVAERQYQPQRDLEEMNQLHVTVVPRGVNLLAQDRANQRTDVEIDIAVQKRVGEDLTDVDSLLQLVEEIIAELWSEPFIEPPSARIIAIRNEPLYAPDHLRELRQFTSVVTATYRILAP